MTQFHEFVDKVYTQFLKRYSDGHTTSKRVQEVLSEVDIADEIQHEQVVASPQRLFLRRLQISGRKHKFHAPNTDVPPFRYNRSFEPGMNGWVAGNGSGKSTVMKAIVWALTGVEQHFKQDIRSWIEEVLLEFSIADGIYTIRYAPRPEQPKVTGFIAMADINTVSQNESTLHILTTFVGAFEMTERIDAFFSEKLHFLQPQPSIHDENQKKISWQVYSQALFLGGDYTDYLFPKSNLAGKPHQKTLSIYLGLGSTDALTKLELVRDKARDDYKFESRRIMTNAQGVREKIGHFQNELQDVDLQFMVVGLVKTVFDQN